LDLSENNLNGKTASANRMKHEPGRPRKTLELVSPMFPGAGLVALLALLKRIP